MKVLFLVLGKQGPISQGLVIMGLTDNLAEKDTWIRKCKNL